MKRSLLLETFLDEQLKKQHETVLRQREEYYTLASQAHRMSRYLTKDMPQLTGTSPSEAQNKAPPTTTMLMDLGQHVYAQAMVETKHLTSSVIVDIGPGPVKKSGTKACACDDGGRVLVPLTIAEAVHYFKKREAVMTKLAEGKTKEALKLKYRIRLVMEAIRRLNMQQ